MALPELQSLLFHEIASPDDVTKVVHALRKARRWSRKELWGTECFVDLPYCVVGSVFSINALSATWVKALKNFDCNSAWKNISAEREKHDISEFIALLARKTDEENAEGLFKNRQRTSARSGILKSEAARRFADALCSENLNSRDDLNEDKILRAFRRVRSIPGQASGISYTFFLMLSGLADFVKPDRRIMRFTSAILRRKVTANYAAEVVRQAAYSTDERPVDLDLTIWKLQGGEVL